MFRCMECGRKFKTATAAERAAFGDRGCPGCGGSDIDLGSDANLRAHMRAAEKQRSEDRATINRLRREKQ